MRKKLIESVTNKVVRRFIKENMINEIGAETLSQAKHAGIYMPKSTNDMTRDRIDIYNRAFQSYIKPYIGKEIKYKLNNEIYESVIKDISFGLNKIKLTTDDKGVITINLDDNTVFYGTKNIILLNRKLLNELIKLYHDYKEADKKHLEIASNKYKKTY